MRITILCILLPLSACRLALDPGDFSFDRDAGLDGSTDAADAAPAECAIDANCARAHQSGRCNDGQCVDRICDDGFASCDGVANTGCETDINTLSNCGVCGLECDGTQGTPTCDRGRCEITCSAGFANCGGDNDGCESDLASGATCGDCVTACPSEMPHCDGPMMCVLDCSAGTTLCGTSCIDLATSTAYCGACNIACDADPLNASSTCMAGDCATICDAGFGSCDDSPDSCETNFYDPATCGDCETTCPGALNAAATCPAGACRTECNFGFGDCVGDAGCETNTRTDLLHCGGCDVACAGEHASWTCSDSCIVDTCDESYGDCNRNAIDGCEVTLLDDEAHCGGCDVACDAGSTCSLGACIEPMITAGRMSACRLLGTGAVECWGRGDAGQIGNGAALHQTRPTLVIGVTAHVISVGSQFACAIDRIGRVTCWGRNQNDELGSTTGGNRASAEFLVPGGGAIALPGFRQLDTGESHGCALGDGGTVWCWGRGDSGQTALVSKPGRGSGATLVPLSGPASTISVGTTHSCAVVSGEVFCWGRGNAGQLGDGGYEDPEAAAVPVPVRAGTRSDYVEVAAGAVHTCARTDTNTVWCWGGMLGNPTGFPPTAIPARVPVLDGATWLEASRITCGGLPGGTACIGPDALGQLGDGEASAAASFLPFRLSGWALHMSGRVQPAPPARSSRARRAAGAMSAWGSLGGAISSCDRRQHTRQPWTARPI